MSFDFKVAEKKLALFRAFNVFFLIGTFVLVFLVFYDFLTTGKVQLDSFFIVSLLLNIAFGYGVVVCKKNIKFVEFQIQHFSEESLSK